jgi:hypothetical protein
MRVNRRGHPETLIAKHPGNTNALKAGVFSSAALEPRIAEIEASLDKQDAHKAAIAVLRYEIASLLALGQAMDSSLEQNGIEGRRGEPRTLITLRLRVNDRLRKTLDQYMQVTESPR